MGFHWIVWKKGQRDLPNFCCRQMKRPHLAAIRVASDSIGAPLIYGQEIANLFPANNKRVETFGWALHWLSVSSNFNFRLKSIFFKSKENGAKDSFLKNNLIFLKWFKQFFFSLNFSRCQVFWCFVPSAGWRRNRITTKKKESENGYRCCCLAACWFDADVEDDGRARGGQWGLAYANETVPPAPPLTEPGCSSVSLGSFLPVSRLDRIEINSITIALHQIQI